MSYHIDVVFICNLVHDFFFSCEIFFASMGTAFNLENALKSRLVDADEELKNHNFTMI